MLYKLWISTQLSGVKKPADQDPHRFLSAWSLYYNMSADVDLHSFQKRDPEFWETYAKNDSSTKRVDPDEIWDISLSCTLFKIVYALVL